MAEDVKKPEEMTEDKKTPTVEELLAQIAELTKSVDALKAANSKASSEAADYKKKYREGLDEAKRKEDERAERERTMEEELTALKAEKRVSTYTAKLLEAGYDAQTAATMASSLPEGIPEDFFTSQKAFLEAQKQNAKKEVINAQPGLPSGMPPQGEKKDPLAKYFGL